MLNDLEEPVRAMLPQIRRTVDAAESISTRLSGPMDEVIPGLQRLADTLNSPVVEQAGKMFGLRLPPRPEPPVSAPASAPVESPPAKAPAKSTAKKRAPAKKKAPPPA
jgi:hypothetical protein